MKLLIGFNVDSKFNMLCNEINDNKNFDRIKQIEGENNEVMYDSNWNDNNNNK